MFRSIQGKRYNLDGEWDGRSMARGPGRVGGKYWLRGMDSKTVQDLETLSMLTVCITSLGRHAIQTYHNYQFWLDTLSTSHFESSMLSRAKGSHRAHQA